MVAEEKGNLLGVKGPNKGKKLRQLASYCMKLWKGGSHKDGVEGVFDIHL
jgi:hypothetical protein